MKHIDSTKTRQYKVTLTYEYNSKEVSQGIEFVKRTMELMGFKSVDVELVPSHRTEKQNRAMHLFFTMLGDELNAAGYDMKKFLRQDIDIPWTPYNVKEFLWRKVQLALFGKKSTKSITGSEINKIYDVINRATSERCGVHVPFPSIELDEEDKN